MVIINELKELNAIELIQETGRHMEDTGETVFLFQH